MSFLDNFTITYNSDNRQDDLYIPEENTLTIGSSTTHIFSLPFIYSQYVNYCEIIYKQGINIVLTKTDYIVQESNEEGSSILKVYLTQEDTKRFRNSVCDTFVQLRIVNLNNEISYSTQTKIKVINSLDEGKTANRGYLYKNKVTDYLYEVAFDTLDYEYAYNYFKNNRVVINSGCTSVRWYDYFGRNQDWLYGNKVAFVVKTPSGNGHYATIGISDLIDDFDVDTADSETNKYKIIPFGLSDGINEKGLCMSVNTVPSLKNKATQTTGSRYDEVAGPMLIRYCLDKFASVAELKYELPKHTSIFNILDLDAKGFEQQWLIADATQSTILEIKNNKIRFVDTITSKQAVTTNFHLSDVILNPSNTVYSPIDVTSGHKPTRDNNIEPYGKGLERYNSVVSYLSQINGAITQENMRTALNNVLYTRAYPTSSSPASPYWYSECVGSKLTIDNPPADFTETLQKESENFINRERGDNKTWFTSHSSIYDINTKKLYIVSQEDTDLEYIFTL